MTTLTRRSFSRAITGSIAAALAYPALAPNLDAELAGAASELAPSPAADPASPVLLNYNENPYGPSPKARAALAKCAAISNRYPDDAAKQLKAVLAKKHNVAPENIALGCGSTEILKCADAAFLPAQSNLVAPLPTFEAILEYAEIGGTNTVKIPLTTDHRQDIQRMAASCTSKTGIVYLCNPNNPTGTFIPRDELTTFVAAVPPTTLILIDEAYFEFADAPTYGTATPLIAAHPNVLVARTFSKIYGMAGMRLGYGVGGKPTIELLSRYFVQDNINAAVIAAATASLEDYEGLAVMLDKLMRSRDWLYAQLTKDGRTYIPSQGNFVMLSVGTDAKPIIAKFAEHNVLVGRYFPSMPEFIRVTIGTQPEMEAFVAALRQVVPASGVTSTIAA
jgi:histidinol-phosphate aminotransferase